MMGFRADNKIKTKTFNVVTCIIMILVITYIRWLYVTDGSITVSPFWEKYIKDHIALKQDDSAF